MMINQIKNSISFLDSLNKKEIKPFFEDYLETTNQEVDSTKFQFTNLLGEVKTGQWLDAYFGFFTIGGS